MSKPTLEERLRALWEEFRAGPFEDIPRSHVMAALSAAARIGDEIGYARGRADAERAAFEFVSNHPECPSSAFAHDVANAIHAAAQRTEGER